MFNLLETTYLQSDVESSSQNEFQTTSSFCKCLMRQFFQNITVRMSFTRATMLLSGQQLVHILPVTVSSLESAVHDQTSFVCLVSLSRLWHVGCWHSGFPCSKDRSLRGHTCLLGCDVLTRAELWIFSLSSQESCRLPKSYFFGSFLSTFLLAGLLLLEANETLWLKRNYH